MADEKSTFEIIIDNLGEAIKNVIDDLGNPVTSPQTTLYFLRKLGWNVPVNTDFSSSPLAFVSNLSSIDLESPGNYLNLLGSLKNIISDFDQIGSNLGLSGLANFGSEFPRQLLDYTIMRHLEFKFPKLFAFFVFMGVFDNSYQPPALPDRIGFKQYKIQWERLLTFLKEPNKTAEIVYGWGTSSFNSKLFIEAIEYIFSSLDITWGYYKPTNGTAAKFNIKEDAVYVPFVDQDTIKVGIDIYSIPTDSIPDNAGIAISPFLFGSSSVEISIGDFFAILLKGSVNLDKTTGVEIRPQTDIKLFDINSSSTINGSFEATLKLSGAENLMQIGAPDSSRLDIGSIELTGKVQVSQSNQEFLIELAVKKSKIVIDVSGGDGFISSVLPLDPINVPLDLAIGYSTRTGIYFRGSAGIEIQLPVHLELGPISIEGLTIAAKIEDRKLPVSVGAGFKAELGPLQLVIEDIGVTTNFSFPENNRGNIGPFDLDFGFKPPKGIGLSINAGAVIGGGYLFFDFDKEEYAGVLELTIAGFISASAIGLITTKMPDGSKGFSMLIIITAEFNPPFQLGYGFTLIGVGGLLGLNRTVLLDPLRDGVRNGSVNSIMFPQNVVANAPKIISDLKAIFPPYNNKFLIGPMGKLGWGTPTLISLSLGIIIEIPGNIAILGVLKVALPDEHIPIILIQVAFVGTLDFDKKMLTFDASLYGSFILFMTLEGDMAVRLKWEDNPDFILTVGGFHPQYTPPPLSLPTLRRLAINVLNTDIYLIRVECYQAVTSNTVQFGAKAEIKLDLRVCSIDGYITFDALFQFSPFYFIISASAGFSLSAAGFDLLSVHVKMSLEGPTPWRAKGTGSVSLLFFDISADFDITWGDSKDTSLPKIEVFPLLLQEVNKPEQWRTVLSTSRNLLVVLRKFDETETSELILHPSGELIVSQKFMPLTIQIDRVGNQDTSDINKADFISAITRDSLNNPTPLTVKHVDEDFAPAQYQKLSDADKLSKPSFEKMPGGVSISLGTENIKNGRMVRKIVEYEITIVDKEPKKPLPFGLFFKQIGVLFNNFLRGHSAAKSVLSKNYKQKLQPFEEKTDVVQEGYTVAFQSNNKAYGSSATFGSEMMAQSYMNEQISKNPSLKKDIHIIHNYELN